MNQFIAFYPSQDLKASQQFYQNILELELSRDQGVCLIFKVNEGGFIGFCNHLEVTENPNFIITIVTDDVDGVYEKLERANVTLESKPKLNEKYQIYHFFARDPNGYKLEVQKFLEPLS